MKIVLFNNISNSGGKMEEQMLKNKDKIGILKTKGLVRYQKDAIVSREILKKPKVTLTFFAFDQGQGLSEHTTPFDALVYILDGEAQITISQKAFVLKKDEAIIMPANRPHALKAVKRFKMVLMMIR